LTESEERILVCAPVGRDARLTCDLLVRAKFGCTVCANLAEVIRRLGEEGGAALLLAEETLSPAGLARIEAYLGSQPAWSDLPIVVFSSPEGSLRRISSQVVARLGNVTLLDRPVRPITMVSAARAALRARRRQYALRGELDAQRLAVTRRDEFLAMLGHELRNPLSAILLSLEVLEKPRSDQVKYRAIVRRQAQHLARLVDDLLDVARVTSGKIVLQREPVDLGALVRRSVVALETATRAQDLHVETATPSRPAVISGDLVRLEQVVVNLVSNAIKYTPRGGHIAVTVAIDDGDAVLHVADDGVGLAPEVQSRIFDLFAQAPETLDRSRGGLGIGLTLVRSLVDLHGGSVTVASDGVGKGSCFTARLPLAVAPALAMTSSSQRGADSPTTHRVLVVEDNRDTRDTLIELLRELGHRVDGAVDGLEAVDRAGDAEVLVVDIGLPGIDGYEVARRVRAARGREVYLIALTGYGQPEDRRRALEAGFDLHFTKPVDIGELGRVLARTDLTA
jgi:signal transduction histidine kinase/CheY-like chemotaxis protein